MDKKITKSELIKMLMAEGFSEDELKKMTKAELVEKFEAAAKEGDELDEKQKPDGVAKPIKEKPQEVKKPIMMVPSKKTIMVIGKKYCSVPGVYIQPGVEVALPLNVHEKLVKAGTAERLYTVKA